MAGAKTKVSRWSFTVHCIIWNNVLSVTLPNKWLRKRNMAAYTFQRWLWSPRPFLKTGYMNSGNMAAAFWVRAVGIEGWVTRMQGPYTGKQSYMLFQVGSQNEKTTLTSYLYTLPGNFQSDGECSRLTLFTWSPWDSVNDVWTPNVPHTQYPGDSTEVHSKRRRNKAPFFKYDSTLPVAKIPLLCQAILSTTV